MNNQNPPGFFCYAGELNGSYNEYQAKRGGDVELKNYELAEQDYMNGMNYKDIAHKYDVSLNTVKSCKTRYGWDKKGVHTKTKKVCTQKIEKEIKKEAAAEAVEQVMKSDTLSDDEQLFCLYYIKCFNATKAYMKVHPNVKYESAMSLGCRLLKRQDIMDEIKALKQAKMNRAMLEPEDIFQKYMDIAFADMTDYIDFGQKEVEVMGPYGSIEVTNEETGEKEPLMKTDNFVSFREGNTVDGTLISEIIQGRDGARVKLLDRMKALEWLADHMDLATPEQAAKVAKLQAETARMNAENRDDETEDDGFIEALRAEVPETWEDE